MAITALEYEAMEALMASNRTPATIRNAAKYLDAVAGDQWALANYATGATADAEIDRLDGVIDDGRAWLVECMKEARYQTTKQIL